MEPDNPLPCLNLNKASTVSQTSLNVKVIFIKILIFDQVLVLLFSLFEALPVNLLDIF